LSFRLAHISDVHLGPLPPVSFRQLLSKRITGYINWQKNRKQSLGSDTLDGLVDHLKQSKPDHIAITGDLVNLALPLEYENALLWLKTVGSGGEVSVVPGNHDAYVRCGLETAQDRWFEYMTGDQNDMVAFPYVKYRDEVALIGLNSGCATLPFMATGCFGQDQAMELERILQSCGEKNLFRVIMIHHPPFEGATASYKKLIGDDLFREVVLQHGTELIIHGHTHIDSLTTINGPSSPITVVGVPSASHGWSENSHKPAARYNLFDIERSKNSWTCQMQEFGYDNNEGTVRLLAQRNIATQ